MRSRWPSRISADQRHPSGFGKHFDELLTHTANTRRAAATPTRTIYPNSDSKQITLHCGSTANADKQDITTSVSSESSIIRCQCRLFWTSRRLGSHVFGRTTKTKCGDAVTTARLLFAPHAITYLRTAERRHQQMSSIAVLMSTSSTNRTNTSPDLLKTSPTPLRL